ncbi:MAG: arabinose ABC transporter substrate-binding protein [Planctomycetota bacterium]
MVMRLIAGLLSLCSMVCLGACTQDTGRGGAAPGRVVLGFLVKQPVELWFQNEWKFAQACADQLGFELLKIGATDGEKVLAAIDNLAARGAQGFVICTPDVHLGPAIMTKARSYGMKVFTVDDQFLGPDGAPMDVPYMGISSRAIGETVGAALFTELGRRGWHVEETAACAITFDELQTARERTDGTRDALVAAGFPADRIYTSATKTPDVPGGLDAAAIVLAKHPEVKNWLVYSVNDEGVLGAVRAMENRGFSAEQIAGIGIGAGAGCVEFEKERPTGFVATCLISPYRHGFEAAELLYRWVKDGEAPPRDTRTEGIIVDRTNYKQVMKEQELVE